MIVALKFRRKRGRPLGSRDRNGRARPVDHRAREMSAWRHFMLAFGARLRFLREERDIAATEIAEAIGVSKMTVWSWERGSKFPCVASLMMVAAALGCSLVELLPDEAHHRVEPVVERAA